MDNQHRIDAMKQAFLKHQDDAGDRTFNERSTRSPIRTYTVPNSGFDRIHVDFTAMAEAMEKMRDALNTATEQVFEDMMGVPVPAGKDRKRGSATGAKVNGEPVSVPWRVIEDEPAEPEETETPLLEQP